MLSYTKLYILNLLLINMATALYCQEYQKPIIVIDRSVLSNKPYKLLIGLQAVKEGTRILWNHSEMLLSVVHIVKKGMALAEKISGMGNLVYALSKELEQEGYERLSQEEKEMIINIVLSSKKPNQKAFDIIQELIKKNFVIIVSTNQDTDEFAMYRNSMIHDHALSIEAIAKGGMVSTPIKHLQKKQTGAQDYYEIENNLLVAAHANPSESFFVALRALANKHAENAPIYMVCNYKTSALEEEAKVMGEKFGIFIFESVEQLRKMLL